MQWNVWYRPGGAEGNFSRDQDKGTLTIEGDNITYEGKKTPHISFDNIRSVGKQRISLWLMWASIEYEEDGEVKRANFGDRKLLGWGGVLGSNAKMTQMAEEVRARRAAQPGPTA
jgi:hypothetical protein